MIRTLINHFFPPAPGGSTEAALTHEGISVGLALLILLVLAAAAIWAYHWGAPGFSRFRRAFLAGLRILLIGLFVLLMVKPVLMLTINVPVREKLLVIVDDSQSMGIKDRRRTDDDEKRAALAAGLIPPAAGLSSALPADMGAWRDAARSDLLTAIAGNESLKLWPRLQEKADLAFYSMGRDAHPLGQMGDPQDDTNHVSIEQAKSFFQNMKYPEEVTAIGDSLHEVLDENRGQAVTGILMITDGGNNSGITPEEVADVAKQDGLPLYLYGVGITKPKDIVVHDISGSRGVFVKERADFTVKVRGSGYAGEKAKLNLKADGKVVDSQDITLTESDAEYKLGYSPQEKGEAVVEASIDPRDDESAIDNNAVSTKVRVLDSKVKVLYIEGDPRWDFRYLLATLQRDRRLTVKCVLLNGDPDLGTEADSPFLKGFPAERGDLVSNEIIILGDVDPAVLGAARMKLLNEWVSDMGGGLIFLAGMKHDPFQYANTPLEPLLPVELSPGLTEPQWSARSRGPVALKLTPTGEVSNIMKLSDDPELNRKIWKNFAGVRWTARVARARPTAQVFLEDSRPTLANQDDFMPVIAQQQYGKGQVMYFGFDETYRWRSDVGERYYIRIWDQVIQSFSLERETGASARTQLKVERPEYLPKDKVVISGQVYSDKFAALTDPVVPGTITIITPDGKQQKVDVNLISSRETPGDYSLEYTPTVAGEYHFTTILDPKAMLKFDVVDPKIEFADTAMNETLLQNMAQISGGKFLREEDLNGLPALISSHSATVPTFKKLDLCYSVWWMVALMTLAALEWLFRRIWQLK